MDSLKEKLLLLGVGAAFTILGTVITAHLLTAEYTKTKTLKSNDLVAPVIELFYVDKEVNFNLEGSITRAIYLLKNQYTALTPEVKVYFNSIENKDVECSITPYPKTNGPISAGTIIKANFSCVGVLQKGMHSFHIFAEREGNCPSIQGSPYICNTDRIVATYYVKE